MKNMKKILLFILLFSIGTSAQFNRFGFGKSEYFNVSVSIDPMGSIDTETPNFTTEIELVENAFYVKTGIQVNPGLVGGYIDYAGAIGFNLTSGIFENIRYYGGIRLGTIIRNGNGYPLFGYETGFNVDITDKIFIGLRSTYDYRSDNEFWETDAEYKFNGSIRIGKRF